MYEIHKFIEKFKSIKAFLNVELIDYKDNNYFNEIKIKTIGSNNIVMNINKKSFYIPIFGFENKEASECEISIINSRTKDFKIFKITIYKYFINNINIYLNNTENEFYSSEIILYGNIKEANLNNL